jgi:hypothetical protein
MEFQRMKGTDAMFQRFIEASPDLHGTKERRHSTALFRASTIDPSLKLHTRRSGLVAVGLQAMQDPHHNAAANLA